MPGRGEGLFSFLVIKLLGSSGRLEQIGKPNFGYASKTKRKDKREGTVGILKKEGVPRKRHPKKWVRPDRKKASKERASEVPKQPIVKKESATRSESEPLLNKGSNQRSFKRKGESKAEEKESDLSQLS